MTRRSGRAGSPENPIGSRSTTSEESSSREHRAEREPSVIESADATLSTKEDNSVNEDRLINDPDNGFFAVIDGMGGHLGGAEAAKTVHDYLSLSPDRPRFVADDISDPDVITDKLHAIFTSASRAVCEQYPGAGAVGVIAQTVDTNLGKKLVAGWVGDSRLYYFSRSPDARTFSCFVSADNFNYHLGDTARERRLADQNILASVNNEGEIRAQVSDARKAGFLTYAFEHRNEVRDYMGHLPNAISFDYTVLDVKKDDLVLLFSDGVHDNLKDSEIREIVAQHYDRPVTEIVQAITEATKNRSYDGASGRRKKDDITVVAFRLNQSDHGHSENTPPGGPSAPSPILSASQPILSERDLPQSSTAPEQLDLSLINSPRADLVEKRSALQKFGVTESDIAAIQKRIRSGIVPHIAIESYVTFSAFNVFMPLTRSITVRGSKKEEAISLLKDYFDSYKTYAETQQDLARSLWGKAETDNLSSEELVLRKAKIFEEIIVNEHQRVLEQSKEQLPVRERTIVGALVDWWRELPLWKRTLINTIIATGVFAALSPGIGVAGGIAYGVSRFARGFASASVGQIASKGVKYAGDWLVEKKYENNLDILMDVLRTPEGIQSLDHLLDSRRKEFEELVRERDTDRRLVTALAVCFGAGVGFSAGIGLSQLDQGVESYVAQKQDDAASWLFGKPKPTVPVEHATGSGAASTESAPAASGVSAVEQQVSVPEQYGPKLSQELQQASAGSKPVAEFFVSENGNPVSSEALAQHATVGQGGSAWGTVHSQLQYLLQDARIAPEKLGLRLSPADLSDATKVRHALDVKTLEILKENGLMESGIARPGVKLNLSAFTDSNNKIHFRVEAPIGEKNPVFYKYTPERTSVPVEPHTSSEPSVKDGADSSVTRPRIVNPETFDANKSEILDDRTSSERPITNLKPTVTEQMPHERTGAPLEDRPLTPFDERKNITPMKSFDGGGADSSADHGEILNPEASDAIKDASLLEHPPISKKVLLDVIRAPYQNIDSVQKFLGSLHVDDVFARQHWNAFSQMSVGEFLRHLDEINRAKIAGASAAPIRFTLDVATVHSAQPPTHIIDSTDPALQAMTEFFSTEKEAFTSNPFLETSMSALTVEQYLLRQAQGA